MRYFNMDFFIGLIFVAFAMVMFTQTVQLPSRVAIFPKTCIYIIALMGILGIVKSFLKQTEHSIKVVFNKEVGVAAVALIIAYYLMTVLGFYSTAAMFIFFMFIYIDRQWSTISVLKGGLFSIIMTLGLYFLFSVLIGLMPPEGLLI